MGMMFIAESAGVAAALTGFVARGTLVKTSTLLAPSIWQGPGDRATIALTFDDGPSESTPRLLDVLERHQVKATFFQCGFSVRRLPWIAREVSGRGHELGNHTYSHPHLCLKSPWFIQRELSSAQKAIMDAAGVRPRLFRAPFGLRWIGLRRAQKRLGLMGVLWSVIGFDWQWQAPAVARHVLAQARNGAIICLHDGRRLNKNPDISTTLTAIETIIPALLEQGFEFETVSQMFAAASAARAQDQEPGRKSPSVTA